MTIVMCLDPLHAMSQTKKDARRVPVPQVVEGLRELVHKMSKRQQVLQPINTPVLLPASMLRDGPAKPQRNTTQHSRSQPAVTVTKPER